MQYPGLQREHETQHHRPQTTLIVRNAGTEPDKGRSKSRHSARIRMEQNRNGRE